MVDKKAKKQLRLEERKYVAELIRYVLIGNITVRDALLNYPRRTSSDESLAAPYHALIHYEADEDLRARDALYKEEQDDYLELLAHILENGEDLPDNIIKNYKKYYKSANIPNGNDTTGVIKSFLRFLNIS